MAILRRAPSVAATVVTLDISIPQRSGLHDSSAVLDPSKWSALDDLLVADSSSFSTLQQYDLRLDHASHRDLKYAAEDHACNNDLIRTLFPQLSSKLSPVKEACVECALHEYVS